MSWSIHNNYTNKSRHVPSPAIVSKCYWKACQIQLAEESPGVPLSLLAAVLASEGD